MIQVQIIDEAACVQICAYSLGERNQSIMNKYERKTGFFQLSKEISLGEEKKNDLLSYSAYGKVLDK